jgi:hypothetical protein
LPQGHQGGSDTETNVASTPEEVECPSHEPLRFLYPYTTKDELDNELAKVKCTLEKEDEIAALASIEQH